MGCSLFVQERSDLQQTAIPPTAGARAAEGNRKTEREEAYRGGLEKEVITLLLS